MQDEDDDAMLLGAQFCSDSFSSISIDAANGGVSYSLFARYTCMSSMKELKVFTYYRYNISLYEPNCVYVGFSYNMSAY